MLCRAGEGIRISSKEREGKDRVAMRLKAHLPKLWCEA